MNSSSSRGTLECSVVIATYRGADRLPIVLASLARQTVGKDRFEVVLVDDGSPEGDALKLRKSCEAFENDLHIQIVHCDKNGGPARARNQGIKVARGQYIFFTDDDCELPAQWIETHVQTYRERPYVSFVGGWYFFLKHEIRRNVYAQFWYFHYRGSFGGIDLETFVGVPAWEPAPLVQNTANFSMRRSVLVIVPGFDENFIVPGREDTDLAKQLRDAGFTSYFLPVHVRHTSALTFRRFYRVMMNRGLAHYTQLRKERWQRYRSDLYRIEFSVFRQLVDDYARKYPGVRRNKWKLILLARMYYWATGSLLALRIHERRWTRLKQRRDGN